MARSMNGKKNTSDGSKGNGGMMPHSGGAPMKAQKGSAKMPQGKHPMAPGCNTATN